MLSLTWPRFWLLSTALFALLLKFGNPYLHTSLQTFIFFISQGFLWAIYWVKIYPNYISPLRNLPQPEGATFFNGHWAASIKEPAGPFRKWSESIPNNGLIRYLHLCNRERLIVTNPEGLREILSTKCYDFVKPYLLRAMVGKVLGIGLLLAEGEDHKHQRKNLMPAFNYRHIKDLYPIFWSKSREVVRGIQKELQSSSFKIDIATWSSRASLDIIGLAGMDHDFGSLSDPSIEGIMQSYNGMVHQSRTAKLFTMLQLFLPTSIVDFLPFKRNTGVLAASRAARQTSLRLIQEKREKKSRGEKLGKDIISVALESGAFTDEGLVNTMMTFLAAGHETSAAAFIWAVYLLANDGEAQKRLREEVRSNIASLEEDVLAEKLDGLLFLHAVCNEALRLYAPIPFTVREAVQDTVVLDTPIPKGTMLVLPMWAIHWSKEVWGENAHEFSPERWLKNPGSGGAKSNYAFLTFLHGPRGCIGQKFSMGEMMALVAAFVGRFEFWRDEADGEVRDVTDGIVAKPVGGLDVCVKVVEGW